MVIGNLSQLWLKEVGQNWLQSPGPISMHLYSIRTPLWEHGAPGAAGVQWEQLL
jgi:hypothetical protein